MLYFFAQFYKFTAIYFFITFTKTNVAELESGYKQKNINLRLLASFYLIILSSMYMLFVIGFVIHAFASMLMWHIIVSIFMRIKYRCISYQDNMKIVTLICMCTE